MINMGAASRPLHHKTNTIDQPIAEEIKPASCRKASVTNLPEIILEPGRSLNCQRRVFWVSESGADLAQVAHRRWRRWCHRRGARFFRPDRNHLDESIKVPDLTEKQVRNLEDVCSCAGPTCDSADIMYDERLQNTATAG